MAGVRLEGNVPGAGNVTDGDILSVRDFDGYPLGYGFINTHSKIRIRMLTRYQTDSITPALIRRRVRDAWEYRKAVMGSDICSCRVIFGEADFLPGITIDKFEDVLVIESLALGTDRLKLLILRYLTQVLEEDSILIRGIYERSDAKVRKLEGMELHKGFIGPEFDTNVPITENGIRYTVDVKDGQKTGFFLDQKYNRAAVARIVRNMQEAAAPGSMTQGAAEQTPGSMTQGATEQAPGSMTQGATEQAPGSNPGGLRVLPKAEGGPVLSIQEDVFRAKGSERLPAAGPRGIGQPRRQIQHQIQGFPLLQGHEPHTVTEGFHNTSLLYGSFQFLRVRVRSLTQR